MNGLAGRSLPSNATRGESASELTPPPRPLTRVAAASPSNARAAGSSSSDARRLRGVTHRADARARIRSREGMARRRGALEREQRRSARTRGPCRVCADRAGRTPARRGHAPVQAFWIWWSATPFSLRPGTGVSRRRHQSGDATPGTRRSRLCPSGSRALSRSDEPSTDLVHQGRSGNNGGCLSVTISAQGGAATSAWRGGRCATAARGMDASRLHPAVKPRETPARWPRLSRPFCRRRLPVTDLALCNLPPPAEVVAEEGRGSRKRRIAHAESPCSGSHGVRGSRAAAPSSSIAARLAMLRVDPDGAVSRLLQNRVGSQSLSG